MGDSKVVDLSVGDIYGGDYSSMGLPADLIASSFGKVRPDVKYRYAMQHMSYP